MILQSKVKDCLHGWDLNLFMAQQLGHCWKKIMIFTIFSWNPVNGAEKVGNSLLQPPLGM